jgi:hypothetical protein
VNASHTINAFVSAASDTLGQLDASVTRRFSRDLAELAGASLVGTPARLDACRHLDASPLVEDAVPSAAALKSAFQLADPQFEWRSAARPDAPERYCANHAFVEVVGPHGHIASDVIRFGVFLLGPQVFYPCHVHEAEEFYLVLAGTADWQQDDDPFRPEPPGRVIQNRSLQPHAMQVKGEPLMLLWGWFGDINFQKYRFV